MRNEETAPDYRFDWALPSTEARDVTPCGGIAILGFTTF